MYPKIGLIIILLIGEIFLGFYSFILSESLLVKFLFFLATAIIIAYCITKFTSRALPSEKILEEPKNIGTKNHDSQENE
ncbi:MAG TPA: hypothetical protein VFM70_04990 [Salinimicrobium sp.]|nr:hypothetical protein [Salinimicrobium sp.]